MRSYCSIYVDAGHLHAAAAKRVTGSSLRSGVWLKEDSFVDALIAEVEADAGLPVLRVHWYDGARGGRPDPFQERIGLLPRVKLRMGRRAVDGSQKGVDLRLGLDLLTHSAAHSTEILYLLSGDDDLSEAVDAAQHNGAQVRVLAVMDRDGRRIGVSKNLRLTADVMLPLSDELIDLHFKPIQAKLKPSAEEETAADAPPQPRADGEAIAGVEVVEAATAPPSEAGSRPSPAIFARRTGDPTPPRTPLPRVELPSRESEALPPPAPTPRRAAAVWSTDSEVGGYAPPVESITEAEAAAAAERVVGVTMARLVGIGRAPSEELDHYRPMIPTDISGAMLVDMVALLPVDELDARSRSVLRRLFWAAYDSERDKQG